MFKRCIVMGLMAWAAISITAARGEDEVEAPAAKIEKANDKLALQALSKKIDALDCENVTLKKTLGDLAKKMDAGVAVDWKNIEAANMKMAAPEINNEAAEAKKSDAITISLRGVTPIQALERIQRQQEKSEALAFAVDNGEITITTYALATKKTFLQTYDVGDLMRLADDEERNDEIRLSFMTFVTSMVAPQTWAWLGGTPTASSGEVTYGVIRCEGKKLLVTSTASVQLEMAAFLDVLRGKGPQFTPEQAAKDLLAKKIDEIKWNDVTLPQAIDDIGKKLGVNVDPKIENNEWLSDLEKKFSFSAHGVTLEQLFRLIAAAMEDSAPFQAYMSGERLVITRGVSAYHPGIVRAHYDVGDLLGKGAAKLSETLPINNDDVQGLMVLIATAVETESWFSVGERWHPAGGISANSTMQSIGSKIIVSAPRQMHLKIAQFLETLRKPKGIEELPVKLIENIPQAAQNKMSLKETLSDLEAKLGKKFFIDWRTLERVNIKPTDVIITPLRNVDLAQALSLIALSIQLDAPMGCYAVGDTIFITTHPEAQKHLELCIHDIADLADESKKELKQVGTTLAMTGSDPVFDLMRLIGEVVDRESWTSFDFTPNVSAKQSPAGWMRSYKGKLIIKATAQNQVKVATVLAKLRKGPVQTK